MRRSAAINPLAEEALERAQSTVRQIAAGPDFDLPDSDPSDPDSTDLSLRPPADPTDPQQFQAHLAAQSDKARDLMRDLMMAPPTLHEVVSEEKIAKMTPAMRLYLTALLYTFGNLTYAAKAAGVTRYLHTKDWMTGVSVSCQTYQEVFPDVYEASIDHAEMVVAQRAIWGTKKFKFNKLGVPLVHPVTNEPYYEYEVSDLLLERYMRARRPDSWKPGIEVSVDLNAYSVDWSVEELQRIAGGEDPQKVIRGRIKGRV